MNNKITARQNFVCYNRRHYDPDQGAFNAYINIIGYSFMPKSILNVFPPQAGNMPGGITS